MWSPVYIYNPAVVIYPLKVLRTAFRPAHGNSQSASIIAPVIKIASMGVHVLIRLPIARFQKLNQKWSSFLSKMLIFNQIWMFGPKNDILTTIRGHFSLKTVVLITKWTLFGNLNPSYCATCETQFETEFVTCRDIAKGNMIQCYEECELFNESCESDCFVLYHYQASSYFTAYALYRLRTVLPTRIPIAMGTYFEKGWINCWKTKNCPCMEYCPNGCPCDGFDCSTTTTTSETPTSEKPGLDENTAGSLQSIG